MGFLGEGINDAPALKIANVAIVGAMDWTFDRARDHLAGAPYERSQLLLRQVEVDF